MSNSRFITYPIQTDSRDLMNMAFDFLQAKIPGWSASEGQLDVWMIEAFSSEAADIGTLSTEVPKAIFRYFGESLFGIPPVDAASAFVNTTWFFTDNVGHVVERGTQFGVRDSAGELHVFVVQADVAVPAGSTQTPSGAVLGIASLPGADATNLGATDAQVELIDPLIWVDHITQTAPTTGGQDAESDDNYLDRLALELQTISPRPILPRDFSILARNVPGVQRATTLDLYNPVNNTWNNERMVTVVSLDEQGHPVAAPVRSQVQAYLDSMREINFIVNVMDATQTTVDITAQVTVLPGWSPSDVASRVSGALTTYLDPAKWGMDFNDNANDPKTWNLSNKIYYLEVSTVINNVGGVDRITYLTVGLAGGAQAPQDATLPGVCPIPSPGNLVITTTT